MRKMKKIFGMIAMGAALFLSTGFSSAGTGNNTTVKECAATSDLVLTAEFGINDMGGDSKLTGTLYNSSTMKAYDDVKIKVDFYSNEELVSSKIVEVDDDIVPGETEEFALEMNAPKVTDRISWAIVCADKD